MAVNLAGPITFRLREFLLYIQIISGIRNGAVNSYKNQFYVAVVFPHGMSSIEGKK